MQVAENNERGQAPPMSMMGAPSTSEYDHMAPYDSRNFLQVNIMQQPQHYSHQLQPTTLQLGYIYTSYTQLSFLFLTMYTTVCSYLLSRILVEHACLIMQLY
jgi:hypothetical protein